MAETSKVVIHENDQQIIEDHFGRHTKSRPRILYLILSHLRRFRPKLEQRHFDYNPSSPGSN